MNLSVLAIGTTTRVADILATWNDTHLVLHHVKVAVGNDFVPFRQITFLRSQIVSFGFEMWGDTTVVLYINGTLHRRVWQIPDPSLRGKLRQLQTQLGF